MKVLKFKYYDEFACKGHDCVNTCCKGWTILFSKQEYFKYKKFKCSPELKKTIDSAFVRTHTDNEDGYAKIKLNDEKACPFLNEDGLCSVQKELGADALSTTCECYPRFTVKVVPDMLLLNCKPDCERVTELFMNHPEGLEIIEEEYDRKIRSVNRGKFVNIISKNWNAYPYYWDIINVAINVLQDRSFSIADRLLILGFYLKKVEDYLETAPGKIPSLTPMMNDRSLCENITESLTTEQDTFASSSKIVNLLFRFYMANSEKNGFIRDVSQSIDFSIDKKDSRYEFHWDNNKVVDFLKKYNDIEEEKSYFVENLLVNDVFRISPTTKLWDFYLSLVVYYAFSRLSIPALLSDNYTDTEIAYVASVTYRNIVQQAVVKGLFFELKNDEAFKTLPAVALLLK